MDRIRFLVFCVGRFQTLAAAVAAMIMAAMTVGGCAHLAASSHPNDTPMGASANSAAYRDAVDRAFEDLHYRSLKRNPAEVSSGRARPDIKPSEEFSVLVSAKVNLLGQSPRQVAIQTSLAPAVLYQFRFAKATTCNVGGATSAAGSDSCFQLEITPVKIGHDKGSRQMVRVLMDTKYRVYAISYHEIDTMTGRAQVARKTIKWDPLEPLSSELLGLSKEISPLDLPNFASNGLKLSRGTLQIDSHGLLKDSERTCEGVQYVYKNTFGSRIQTKWCDGDPWPTAVESNRYVAFLNMNPMTKKK